MLKLFKVGRVKPKVAFVSPAGKRSGTHYEGICPVRPVVRMALAAATAVALTLPTAGVASANPKPDPKTNAMPSQAQVDRARADAANKRQGVAQLEAALAAATARMEAASTAAELAAERYNGAMWRLEEARKETQRAERRAKQAAEDVKRQRDGIVQLVTDSYQNGTELNTATAMMSDEGPKGLMNRFGVVASAGDSMQARYEAFRTASAQAKSYAGKAAKAQEHQKALTEESKKLAAEAGELASAASAAANQIASQKAQLLQAVAEAENISVGLATRRHDALEHIARQKAAAAARAKEAANHAALKKSAHKAQQKANNSKPGTAGSSGGSSGGSTSGSASSSAPPPVINPAPNRAVAIQRTIEYAKQQLGKPYVWAAAGPGSFDCSGLTMQAWARGGKALPHYSVAQFQQSTRISMADARRGDLLFWSSNGSVSGIHHVALYLGGGQFIEAPHTGANVRYNSISNWYPTFAARP
jgi:peptidoglycan DL-endopeptidase CwlO